MDPFAAPMLPMRESQPLNALSPERINAPRSNRSRRMVATDPEATENPPPAHPPASPTRKNNLFADFSFGGKSPTRATTNASELPQSPSLPDITALRSHVRTNSDVQGLVKRFEHLDVRDRDAEMAERKKKHEAELRRAQIAREEAESDVKKLREEVRRLKKEGDESRERERQLGKRVEVITIEYANSTEASKSQVAAYEREYRKARKEAFKSSSAVLKLQEELNSARKTLNVTQSDLTSAKHKVEQREQETFSAQYQFIALQEELEKLKIQMDAMAEENTALKTSLKDEEVAMIAAEGRIALPAGNVDDDDLLGSPTRPSPQKRSRSPLSDDKENSGVLTKKAVEVRKLAADLAFETRRRVYAEELAEFLRLECQFHCCACRSVEGHGQGTTVPLPDHSASGVERVRQTAPHNQTLPSSVARTTKHRSSSKDSEPQHGADPIKPEMAMEVDTPQMPSSVAFEELDQNMTMADEGLDDKGETMELDEERPRAPRPTPVDPMLEPERDTASISNTIQAPLQTSRARSPPQAQQTTPYRQQSAIRTITTTTTIPMQFTPARPAPRDPVSLESSAPPTAAPPSHNEAFPPTLDREAALAAIAYRRGRAKSIADGHVTPRKQMMEGVNVKERRDISAPTLGQKSASVSVPKGAASVGRAAGARLV